MFRKIKSIPRPACVLKHRLDQETRNPEILTNKERPDKTGRWMILIISFFFFS